MFAFIGMPGPMEMTVIAIIAVLLFGSKLPQVAKNAGRGLTEFKKGVAGVQDGMEDLTGELASTSEEVTQAVKKPARRKTRRRK